MRRFPACDPWSSESPSLYRLVLTLVAPDGSPVESRCIRVGFRRVELGDRELLINGRPVLIRGVNRHEHDDQRGKVMTRELMLRDITTLKRFNFNAVRTSHYPDTMEWYDLCDEYGIYLVDEANIEAHANYHSICRDPRWARAFDERMMRMVVRDRNHPSVIAWSAGNETGHGENHVRAIERIRAYDPSRPIHHEGEVKRWWHQRGNEYNGGRKPIERPHQPHVSDHRVDRRARGRIARSPAGHPLRVLARDGQQQRQPVRVLGRLRTIQRRCRAASSGSGSIMESCRPTTRAASTGPTVVTSVRRFTTRTSSPTAWSGRTARRTRRMFEFKKLAQPLGMRALSVGRADSWS